MLICSQRPNIIIIFTVERQTIPPRVTHIPLQRGGIGQRTLRELVVEIDIEDVVIIWILLLDAADQRIPRIR